MKTLNSLTLEYLMFCETQKRLDKKTLKAYRIDLEQFLNLTHTITPKEVHTPLLESYICKLHHSYKPKTVKRKIASIKAFFHYLEYRDYISINPFSKIHTKFRGSVTLPKVIPMNTLELFLSTMYTKLSSAPNDYQRRNILRDIAVIELLFATGIRISELCSLKPSDVNLFNRTILIYGKGAKERII